MAPPTLIDYVTGCSASKRLPLVWLARSATLTASILHNKFKLPSHS